MATKDSHDEIPLPKFKDGWLHELFLLVESSHPAVINEELRKRCEEAALEGANEAYAFDCIETSATRHKDVVHIPLLKELIEVIGKAAGVSPEMMERWLTSLGLQRIDRLDGTLACGLSSLAAQLGVSWSFARLVFARAFLQERECDPFTRAPAIVVPFGAPAKTVAGQLSELDDYLNNWVAKDCTTEVRRDLNSFLTALDRAHRAEAGFCSSPIAE